MTEQRLTHTDYQAHLDRLGSWAELMPPWEVVQEHEERRERQRADAIARVLIETWRKEESWG